MAKEKSEEEIIGKELAKLYKKLELIGKEINRFTGTDIAKIIMNCGDGDRKGRAIIRIMKLADDIRLKISNFTLQIVLGYSMKRPNSALLEM